MSRKGKKKAENINVNRKVVNTGYSDGGASYKKPALAGWDPFRSSPKSDIDSNLSTLRGRSASIVMNTPIGSGAINTSKTNVIGVGLRLSAKCKHEYLGISPEEARAWNKKTMEEFDLWASSKHCDLYKKNNFYDMQDIAYAAQLIDGDSFVLLKYRMPNEVQPYSLRIQLFESSRVCNPNITVLSGMSPLTVECKNQKNNNRIINGVEIDNDGAVVAYWVANRVPYDPTELNCNITWERVEAFGEKTGYENILQIAHDERPEQYRGVPYLAPVIEVLKQISRYTEAELTAAIIKSFFTLFFTENIPNGDGFESFLQNRQNGEELDLSFMELGPATMNCLPMGYDVKGIDAGRSLSTFEPFTNQLIKQIGSSIGQPYEVLMKAFNSSYSASRAALLQAAAEFKTRRIWFSRDFCQPTYERWLTEAIALGRIEAPGFFDDPLKRKAWCNADWYGPVMGVIDPVKEAEGANRRIQLGFSTRERETAEMTGEDFDENIKTLASEERAIKASGATIAIGDSPSKGGEKEDEEVLDSKKSSEL